MQVPAGGQSERVAMAMNVPGGLPQAGPLYWCAYADGDRQVKESNERNNLACIPARRGEQIAKRDDLSKLFGSAMRNKDLSSGTGSRGVTVPPGPGVREGINPMDTNAGTQASKAAGEKKDVAKTGGEHHGKDGDKGDAHDAQRLTGFSRQATIRVNLSILGTRLDDNAERIEDADVARELSEIARAAVNGLTPSLMEGVPSGDRQDPSTVPGSRLTHRGSGDPLGGVLGEVGDSSGRGGTGRSSTLRGIELTTPGPTLANAGPSESGAGDPSSTAFDPWGAADGLAGGNGTGRGRYNGAGGESGGECAWCRENDEEKPEKEISEEEVEVEPSEQPEFTGENTQDAKEAQEQASETAAERQPVPEQPAEPEETLPCSPGADCGGGGQSDWDRQLVERAWNGTPRGGSTRNPTKVYPGPDERGMGRPVSYLLVPRELLVVNPNPVEPDRTDQPVEELDSATVRRALGNTPACQDCTSGDVSRTGDGPVVGSGTGSTPGAGGSQLGSEHTGGLR